MTETRTEVIDSYEEYLAKFFPNQSPTATETSPGPELAIKTIRDILQKN